MKNMWKYISRNVRETFERRICSSFTHSCGQEKQSTCKLGEIFLPTIHNFCAKKNDFNKKYKYATSENKQEERSQERPWNDSCIRHSWLGALGWSTVVVLSWNLLQPLCRLQFTHEKEQYCPWSRHEKRRSCPWTRHSSSTCWEAANGKSKGYDDSATKSSHWSFICHQSRRSNGQSGGVSEVNLENKDCGISTNKDEEIDSGHHYLRPERQSGLKVDNFLPRGLYHSTYSGFWKLLTQTVWAQPTRIVPKPTKSEIDCKLASEDTVDYGPPTAEQALSDAAAKFMEAQNSVLGDIDNKIGVELMQHGKPHEAVSHFTRAFDFSNASAAYNLGVCYEMGLGTNQDFNQAAKYYQIASDKGHPTAMYNLGVFYVHGWGGLSSNSDKAHKLFQKASTLGQIDAKKALDMVQMHEIPENSCNTNDLVYQALELVQDLGLGLPKDSKHLDVMINATTDHKDLSDMVQDSILKYTSMLQK